MAMLIFAIDYHLLFHQSAIHSSRGHPNVYQHQPKPSMSLPLVGKFLQVGSTVNITGTFAPTMSCRNTPPLFHSAGRFLALSNVNHSLNPAVRLFYRLSSVLLSSVFTHTRFITNHVRGIIGLAGARDIDQSPRGGGTRWPRMIGSTFDV